MTSQSNAVHHGPDARIDQVLNALRTTEPPAGLEERIAQRIAARLQQPETPTLAHSLARSPFAGLLNAVKDLRMLPLQAKLYATAATALTLLVTLTVLYHRTTPTQPAAAFYSSASTETHTSTEAPSTNIASISKNLIITTQSSHHFNFVSHSIEKTTDVSTPATASDPDTIALAETIAPSRPAPPMPLTAQEHLMLAATRRGQPIQLAELDTASEPFLHAAVRARTDAAIERYVHSFLSTFAVADELQPTAFSQPQEETSTTPPAPQPTDPSSK